jgi:hypothetical protein
LRFAARTNPITIRAIPLAKSPRMNPRMRPPDETPDRPDQGELEDIFAGDHGDRRAGEPAEQCAGDTSRRRGRPDSRLRKPAGARSIREHDEP